MNAYLAFAGRSRGGDHDAGWAGGGVLVNRYLQSVLVSSLRSSPLVPFPRSRRTFER